MKLIGAISTAVLSFTLGSVSRYTRNRSSMNSRKRTRISLLREKKRRRNPRSSKRRAKRKTARSGKRVRSRRKTARKKSRYRSNTPSKRSRASRKNTLVATGADVFPKTVTEPILDAITGFVSLKPTTAIAGSNTGATRSDSFNHGHRTGYTRKMFMLSKSMACITCATQGIRA